MTQSSTVILRHSDDHYPSDDDEDEEIDANNLSFSLDAASSSPTGVSPIRRTRQRTPSSNSHPQQQQQQGTNTADKAGVILGIHNVFVVLPQFVVTLMASIIFHIMEPGSDTTLPPKHPNTIPIGNGTVTDLDLDTVVEGLKLVVREGMVEGGSSDAVGLIFR
jgi:solute carrier family 45 protein 1/2/4